jgi:cation diffusion facilitator family transporter
MTRHNDRLREVRKVLLITLLLNLAVAVVKIFYGYGINSISMFSDGFHSLFDGTSNIVGLAGVWIASMPPDESHPYGHKKFETLSVIAIVILIFGAGFEILKAAYDRIEDPNTIEVTFFSFVVMAVTVSINIFVMRYEQRKGRELKSDFLLADAMHTKTDIYVSMSVVTSLVAAQLGYPVVDVIAALVIVVVIVRMGLHVLKSATDVLTDAACISSNDIRTVVNSVQGVMGSHNIRTRGTEDHASIDLHIFVDPRATTQEAHDLAHSVEAALRKEFPPVKDVVIHVEPFDARRAAQK